MSATAPVAAAIEPATKARLSVPPTAVPDAAVFELEARAKFEVSRGCYARLVLVVDLAPGRDTRWRVRTRADKHAPKGVR